MSKKFKRSVFSHVNRFQDKILLPVYVSCLIALFATLLWTLANNSLVENPGNLSTLLQAQLNGPKILNMALGILVVAAFVLLIYWAYATSNKILGAYERILRELDHAIDDRRSGPIKAREDDGLFTELLKRINILIEKRRDEADRLTQELADEKNVPQGLRIPKRTEDV